MKEFDLFFTRPFRPSITLNNGVDWKGTVLDSRGNIYILEVEFLRTSDSRYSAQVYISPVDGGSLSLSVSSPVSVWRPVVKRRQRIGSNVTSLQSLEVECIDYISFSFKITDSQFTIKFL